MKEDKEIKESSPILSGKYFVPVVSWTFLSFEYYVTVAKNLGGRWMIIKERIRRMIMMIPDVIAIVTLYFLSLLFVTIKSAPVSPNT